MESNPAMETIALFLVGLGLGASGPAGDEPPGLGVFEDRSDVGTPKQGGAAQYDPAGKRYSVSGGGSNMWFAKDAFHFVWKKMSGDLAIAADIAFPAAGGDPHRKACLMVRQSLDEDSAYADAALHGSGLTSLQYREAKGAPTREIQSNVSAPARLRLEKRGKYVWMSLARAGGELAPAGGSFRLELKDPFYVGLAVCAHDDAARETAVFSNVELSQGSSDPAGQAGPRVLSTLETVSIASKDRRVVWWTRDRIEAPNWTRDGGHLIFNQEGRLYRIPPAGGEPQPIDTGPLLRLNNDHGISPDGTRLAVSDQSRSDRLSRIFTMPLAGGPQILITERGPSYWHGWSPDGGTMAYCAERDGEFDIYTVPAAGGTEKRLTTAKGLDDGPDYSPDGRFIYFNSERSGRMQVWRMKPDGSDQTQITSDAWSNWFPHPSPDGKWMVFLSYEAGVEGHPEDKDVMLRLMPITGGPIEVLARLLGGQGTINVPSWSPDAKQVAFVSYQVVAPPLPR
jgi:TolB protein